MKNRVEFYKELYKFWFEFLEYSIIVGAIKYVAEVKNILILEFVYWISLAFFFTYLEELVDSVGFGYDSKKSWKKLTFNFIISTSILITVVVIQSMIISNVRD